MMLPLASHSTSSAEAEAFDPRQERARGSDDRLRGSIGIARSGRYVLHPACARLLVEASMPGTTVCALPRRRSRSRRCTHRSRSAIDPDGVVVIARVLGIDRRQRERGEIFAPLLSSASGTTSPLYAVRFETAFASGDGALQSAPSSRGSLRLRPQLAQDDRAPPRAPPRGFRARRPGEAVMMTIAASPSSPAVSLGTRDVEIALRARSARGCRVSSGSSHAALLPPPQRAACDPLRSTLDDAGDFPLPRRAFRAERTRTLTRSPWKARRRSSLRRRRHRLPPRRGSTLKPKPRAFIEKRPFVALPPRAGSGTRRSHVFDRGRGPLRRRWMGRDPFSLPRRARERASLPYARAGAPVRASAGGAAGAATGRARLPERPRGRSGCRCVPSADSPVDPPHAGPHSASKASLFSPAPSSTGTLDQPCV